MNEYTVLIIDDEALARKLLEQYVSKIPHLKLIGSLSNAMEALMFIQKQPVDIIFTDIQMPHFSGIEFVNTLKKQPVIIFTTAYSQYAIEGFELGVTDYLLKPISFPRFMQAIEKAIQYLNLQKNKTVSNAGVEEQMTGSSFFVKSGRTMHQINYDELLYIEGQQEYVSFHTANKTVIAYYSLKKLEEELPAGQFIRIHKSYIISIKHIETIDSNYIVISGKKIPIGKHYTDGVKKWLNSFNIRY